MERFRPGRGAAGVRERHALGDGPLILAPSRLVPRKGHDVLLKAMPSLIDATDASLVIVGQGPYEQRLRKLASALPPGRVAFAGAVPDALLPGYYAASDVAAIPCRSRYLGLEVEGFGIVYLEAAASGRPALAGRSGGTDKAVVDGVTGLVVDGSSVDDVVDATIHLLCNQTCLRPWAGPGVAAPNGGSPGPDCPSGSPACSGKWRHGPRLGQEPGSLNLVARALLLHPCSERDTSVPSALGSDGGVE